MLLPFRSWFYAFHFTYIGVKVIKNVLRKYTIKLNPNFFMLQKDKDKKKNDLPPVQEKETPMSDKDPGTFSGCVLS